MTKNMEDNLRLEELAVIKTGLVTARKQAKDEFDAVAKYRMLNLKAINAKGYIEEKYVETFFSKERLKADYLTQPGDVLVRLTTPYTAVLVGEEQAGWIIPSHFIVIRTSGRLLLSEYLYWLLNTAKVKAELQQDISSVMIGAIKARSYTELEIELLSIQEQKKIAELYLLSQKELSLLDQLMGQKEVYYKEAIDRIQKDMRRRKHEKDN